MKTSINIPEWLHDKVTDTCPDVPFGTLARDALLIALPVWMELGPERGVEQALRAQLRMMQATAAQEGVALPAVKAAPVASPRRAATPTPAPVSRPARPRRTVPASVTRAAAPSPPAR